MPPIEEARASIAAKDWPNAAKLLKEELSNSAPSAEVYYLHGLASFKLQQFAEAETSLFHANQLEPNNAPTLFYLAGCAIALGNPVQGADWLWEYLELAPADAEGWKLLGKILAEEEKPDQALDAFGKALELDPDSNEVRWWIGTVHHRTKRYAEAAQFLATVDARSAVGSRAFDLGIHAAEQAGLWQTATTIALQRLKCQPANKDRLRQLARFQFLACNDSGCLATLRQSATNDEVTSVHPMIARVVTTETWELLANKWIQLHLKSEPVGKSVRIRPSLTRHDRARIICPEWMVLTEANDMLVEQMTHNPHTLHKAGPHVIALADDRCLLDLPEAMVEIDDACVLVGGSHDYYHWLVDSLPRIGIAHKVPALRDLKLLVNDDLTSWQIASLAALGVGTDRLMTIPDNTVAKCRALWVPTLLSRSAVVHPYVPGWLRQRLLTREMKAKPARRLFIRPAPGTGNTLTNEDELASMLETKGFDIIDPQTIDFMGQVALFSAAEIIVSPAAPALANLLFAPREAKIIEIKAPKDRSVSYQLMSQRIGQQYLCLEARAHFSADAAGNLGSIYLDPSRLNDAIAEREIRA